MDLEVKRNHKGYLIDIVVEDDAITTGKLFKGSEFINAYDITDRHGHEFPYNALNRDKVLARFRREVDRLIGEEARAGIKESANSKQ